MASAYADLFRELQPDHDPRHIEGYVRLEYPTLNGCSRETLEREAQIAAGCIAIGGIDAAERCAKSFGL